MATPEHLVRKIYAALSEMDGDPREYSGRGMYGVKCLGFTCENPTAVMPRLIQALIRDGQDDTEAVALLDELNEICELLSDSRTDSMGRQQIIYWPEIDWALVGDSPEEEEFNDED